MVFVEAVGSAKMKRKNKPQQPTEKEKEAARNAKREDLMKRFDRKGVIDSE